MKKIILFVLVLLSSNYVIAQWTKVDGPFENVSVSAMLESDYNILVGASNGSIYLTTNSGGNWTLVRTPSSYFERVTFLYKNKGNIYAGIYSKGIFISKDNGKTWSESNKGLSNFYVGSLVEYKSSLILGCSVGSSKENNVFVSTDQGLNWIPQDFGLPSGGISSLVSNNIYLFAKTNQGYFYKWLDLLKEWVTATSFTTPSGGLFNSISYLDDKLIAYVNGSKGGVWIYFSTDNGISWQYKPMNPLENIQGSFYLNSICVIGTDVYFCSSAGLLKSSDFCESWSIISLKNINVPAIFQGNGKFFTNLNNGLKVSTDSGFKWNNFDLKWQKYFTNAFGIWDENIFAGFYGSGISYSSNNGISWTEKNTGLNNLQILSLGGSSAKLFAGTERGLYISTDGSYWRPITIADKTYTYLVGIYTIYSNDNYIVLGSPLGVFISSDNGSNWLNQPDNKYFCYAIKKKDDKLYAATSYGLMISNNNGMSWQMSGYIPFHSPSGWQTITFLGTKIFYGVDGEGVYASSDDGKSWNNVNEGMTNNHIRVLHSIESNLFAATNDGVFISKDEGLHWFQTGLTGLGDIWALDSNSKYIFAGTDLNGIWKMSITEITEIKTDNINLPTFLSLYQNYPNPFNPTTKIKFGLPESGFTKLIVYDALGREVTTILKSEMSAGYHEVDFNASNLSSGIYFYRIQTNNFTDIKKMLLIK